MTLSGLSVFLPVVIVVVVLVLVSGALLLALARRRFRFYSGIIHGITGDLGGGKSAFACRAFAVPAAKAISSWRGLVCEHTNRRVTQIITNFEFYPEVYGIHDVPVRVLKPKPGVTIWHQIASCGYFTETGDVRVDALVILDEFALECPSDSHKMDEFAKALTVHLRKWNIQLAWIAQDHMLVHKRMRSFSQRVWHLTNADRGLHGLLPGRWFLARAWKGSSMDSTSRAAWGEPLDQRAIRLTKKLRHTYNTFETISDSSTDNALAELVAQVPRPEALQPSP